MCVCGRVGGNRGGLELITGLPVRPSQKMGFRSSAAKNGLSGEGRHEGLVPRNDVLTNTPIQPKTGSCMKARPKGYLSRESQKSWRKTPRLCMEDMECLLM